MVIFRNISATPEDPVTQWGFEGLLTAIERGSIKLWDRIATELYRHPYGAVARLLEEEVIDAVAQEGERELFRQLLLRARRRWEQEARAEVVVRLRALLHQSGLNQRDFAAQLGTSASRLSTYLNGKVTPGADLLVRAERVGIERELAGTDVLRLQPHSSTPCPWVDSVTATIARDRSGAVTGRFLVNGDLTRLRVSSAATEPVRSDGLWRTTCFELFARAPSSASYFEFNFSPSGHWAAYQFDGYRQGMRQLDMPAPEVACEQQAGRLVLHFILPAPALGAGPLQIAASAVLEDREGRLCYWALRHPDGKPDFHHEAGFAARL